MRLHLSWKCIEFAGQEVEKLDIEREVWKRQIARKLGAERKHSIELSNVLFGMLLCRQDPLLRSHSRRTPL